MYSFICPFSHTWMPHRWPPLAPSFALLAPSLAVASLGFTTFLLSLCSCSHDKWQTYMGFSVADYMAKGCIQLVITPHIYGPSLNNVGSTELYKMPLYMLAIQFPITGTSLWVVGHHCISIRIQAYSYFLGMDFTNEKQYSISSWCKLSWLAVYRSALQDGTF